MIKLNKPLASNGSADTVDVQVLKHALNRLGHYTPYEKTGITEIPDAQLFSALKDFQREHKLPVTGVIKPDDETLAALNAALENAPDGQYIWRSVKDEQVRASHAALDGKKRLWSETPYPGQDYNCRCWAEKLSNDVVSRKNAILNKGEADFILLPDLTPNDSVPTYVMPLFSEVSDNDMIIREEAKDAGVDADLVKAIIYVETTQGWYDRYYPYNKSVRPMNIQSEYWKDLGYSREELETPRLNIRAGIDLIKRIQKQIPNASVSVIATLYNDLNAKYINDYGARVDVIMKGKPWVKSKQ